LGSTGRLAWLKRKTPQIVIIAIALSLCIYVLLELLIDTFIGQTPVNVGHSFTETVSSWGYGGVFGLMILEASSLPIPSEIVLPFAGYLVSTGQLNFWFTVVVATTGALAGSLIDYYIGLKGIEALTKYRLLGRAIFSESQLKVAAGWFSKYGTTMVFLGRLIPVIRTLISFPAGAVRMPLSKFLAYTATGCIIWNIILVYVGYYLGLKWKEVADFSHYLVIGAIIAFIVTGGVFLIRRRNRKKKSQQTAKYVT
jgi:membrane protein DedA with SNARE-associated domain